MKFHIVKCCLKIILTPRAARGKVNVRICKSVMIRILLCYTPGIYAEGYIVFVFPFVRSYVRMFVRSFVCSFVRSFVRTSFRHVEFTSKFCVKVTQVVYISATTHQKAFIFGP